MFQVDSMKAVDVADLADKLMSNFDRNPYHLPSNYLDPVEDKNRNKTEVNNATS
jgi:hypothetical protein